MGAGYGSASGTRSFGLVVVAVRINAGLAATSLTRAEWILQLAGQAALLVAVISLLAGFGPTWLQAASAGYLSAFLVGLAPGLYRTVQAADALLGRRRRR